MDVEGISLDRELIKRGGLHEFVRRSWHLVEPGRFSDNWHVAKVCEHLEACHRRQIRKLCVNEPPGCMKSLLVEVFYPAWVWTQTPQEKFLCTSFDQGLTERDARRQRDLVTSEWYRDRWSVRIPSAASKQVRMFGNNAGGWRFSTSTGGKAVGRHANTIVIDDPTKPKDTIGGAEQTRKRLDEAVNYYRGTLRTRQADPESTVQILIMQRLHDSDLAGVLLSEGGWQHLCLPMRFEKKRACVTVLGLADERKEDGELLWPERFSEESVKELEKDLGNFAESQLQQNPVPSTGGIFKADWVKYWSYDGSIQGTVALPKQLTKLQSWDMRFKDSDSSGDWVVGQQWGRGYLANMIGFFLLDQVRGRWSFSDTCDQARSFAAAHPDTIAKLVEDKANGPAVVNTLKKEIAGFEEVPPDGGKEARANAVSGLWKTLSVFLPHPSIAPWVPGFVHELLRFPKALHDDQVDAMTQALARLYLKTPALLEALARMAAERRAEEARAQEEAAKITFKQPEGPPVQSFSDMIAKKQAA